MDNSEATAYLSQFIGQPLRIHTSDGRVFGGQMKCTDKVRYLPPVTVLDRAHKHSASRHHCRGQPPS